MRQSIVNSAWNSPLVPFSKSPTDISQLTEFSFTVPEPLSRSGADTDQLR